MRTGARVLATATALTVLTAVACSGPDEQAGPSDARAAQAAPTSTVDAQLDLSVAEAPGGAVIRVVVTAPPRATRMQVGLLPGSGEPPWTPVADRVELPADAGYQEVIARFETSADAEPQVLVAGIDVDLAAAAATADPPPPSAVGALSPTALAVDVEVGRLERGADDPGDRLVGPEVDATDLDEGWSLDGADGDRGIEIRSVERRTVPTGVGYDDDGDATRFTVRHRIVLRLAGELTDATDYRLRSPLGTVTDLRFDDDTTPSPSVHVNQVGFRPGDRSKLALLTAERGAAWPGDATPRFHVVDVETGESLLDGTATRRTTGTDGEVGRGDLTGLDVWSLDMSALSTPGRYRTCVETLGCSAPWSIDEDSTWMRVATTIARGLYHQRSGLALGQPTTSLARPRPDHPDDGLEVRQSTLTALEAARLPDDQLFERLVAGAGDEVVDGAWGGHFDAGDWDRRTQHLWMARHLLDLARIAPDRFDGRDLVLPESGDAVPDLVDEALWTVDLFRRMQLPDGAVRGGVESARFPEQGTTSWEDQLARFAYSPDPWTTYAYAGVAADAAVLLRPHDPERAAELAASAERAMTWAEAAAVPEGFDDEVRGQRGVAAASMLRLTGDARWNAVFADATPFGDGPQDVLGCNAAEVCDAAWNYLWVDPAVAEPALTSAAFESYVRAADRSAAAADTTLFGWCLEDPDVPLVWGLGVGGAPHAVTLLRAWLLTNDDRYRAAAERCASVSLGANPLDVSYVTGLGSRPPRHPLIVDVNAGALPVWAGTPVYGNHLLGDDTQWVIDHRLRPAGATGDLDAVPYLQSWYDLGDVGPMDEFTVFQSHGPALWVAGVLASAAPVVPGAATAGVADPSATGGPGPG